MALSPPPDTTLRPISGPPRPVSQYLTTFHLVLVALDPFTNESAWILETAGRVLTTFSQADCRVGWLVSADTEDAKTFLGPWADQFSTFVDPGRDVIKALDLRWLPAIVHLGMDSSVIDSAEGWHPREWHRVTEELAHMLSWKGPTLPNPKDPAPYDGTAALG